jgi:hypothetical protein
MASPINASASGNVVTVQANIFGPSGDYLFTISDGQDFAATGATSALAGGYTAGTSKVPLTELGSYGASLDGKIRYSLYLPEISAIPRMSLDVREGGIHIDA